jgi:hypothetical protein
MSQPQTLATNHADPAGQAEPTVLTAEEYEEHQAQQAAQLVQDLGITEPEKTTELIVAFVQSYEQHKTTMPLDEWLVSEFRKYPQVWDSDAELQSQAREVITTVTQANEAKANLYAHVDSGQSEASWVARQMETAAASAGVVHVGQYVAGIDTAIEQANKGMIDTVLRRDGEISQALNLDGFLAEQHHVDTFNMDAAAKGSDLRAKVLTPGEGQTYGKNSMDIGIYDRDGKLVGRYQAKYGQDSDSTQNLWDNGDYRGQRKLVPADQVDRIEGATDRLKHGDVESKPLTKAEAKALQEKAQIEREIKEYDWNDASRIEMAKGIGKQALTGAAVVAALHGVRVFGGRLINKFMSKDNHPLSEDLAEFFASSIKGSANVGAQVAVSGAVVVAARNSWLGASLKTMPANQLAAIAYVGLENAKVLYKFAKGEITARQALDAMGKTTTSLVCSMAGAIQGAAMGAKLGAVLGPVGSVVGGIVGSIVGGMLGSSVGELMHTAGVKLKSFAVSTLKSAASAVGSGLRAVGRGIASVFGW